MAGSKFITTAVAQEGHGAIQSIISQTNNCCSLLSLILAKLLLLDINSENAFALSIAVVLNAFGSQRGPWKHFEVGHRTF